MDIRHLTDTFAVAPQITPEDVPAIAAAGFRAVICNRPDEEVVPPMRAADIRTAVEAAGLTFVNIPVSELGIGRTEIGRQREAIDAAVGPVLAYCASGTRSVVLWMFSRVHVATPDALIAMALAAGYPLGELRQQLEIVAREL